MAASGTTTTWLGPKFGKEVPGGLRGAMSLLGRPDPLPGQAPTLYKSDHEELRCYHLVFRAREVANRVLGSEVVADLI